MTVIAKSRKSILSLKRFFLLKVVIFGYLTSPQKKVKSLNFLKIFVLFPAFFLGCIPSDGYSS
jgi:hypothetical protein